MAKGPAVIPQYWALLRIFICERDQVVIEDKNTKGPGWRRPDPFCILRSDDEE